MYMKYLFMLLFRRIWIIVTLFYLGYSSHKLIDYNMHKNLAARLLAATSRYEHVTPGLRSLHWLPVSTRIDFTILLLVFKVLNGLGPLYLSELLRLVFFSFFNLLIDFIFTSPLL